MKRYSILFTYDTKNHLRMMVRIFGKRIYFNLGFVIDREKWSSESQRCKRNTTHGKNHTPAARINAAIQHYESITTQELENNSFSTTEQVKQALIQALGRKTPSNDSKGEKEPQNFFTLYKQYLRIKANENLWSDSVVKKHQRLIKEWQMFRPDITLEQINENTLNSFREFQIALGHQNETTEKKISMSKWFFRWLVGKGLLTNLSFTTYRPKLKRASRRVIFLTWDELMNVYTYQFPKEKAYLARVRDVFYFCCFTSLRYSDVYALTKKDIYDDTIHITTQKTNDKLTIELNNYSRTILARYTHLEGDKALPVISNQKMNQYLKELGRECSLNEPITDIYYIGGKKIVETRAKWEALGTHCGRRTFICNALMLGIAPSVVMKWTGHSDYKSMKPYIDIADSAKKRAMSLFNQQ